MDDNLTYQDFLRAARRIYGPENVAGDMSEDALRGGWNPGVKSHPGAWVRVSVWVPDEVAHEARDNG